MFADGVSTREEVTMVSGRGVGMSAVKEATLNLGGHIKVKSSPGRGTTF
ncbi:MAG TPA: ATP-binding protein, partial [Polyangia bacterium]